MSEGRIIRTRGIGFWALSLAAAPLIGFLFAALGYGIPALLASHPPKRLGANT